MVAHTLSDRPNFFTPGWLLLVISLVVGMSATPARADTLIDGFVVRYRDAVVTGTATTLPSAQVQKIGEALQSGFVETTRTRDGSFQIALVPPLAIDAARSALNRLRVDPDVLYASFAPPPRNTLSVNADSSAPPLSPPTNRLIVKFIDAASRSAAIAGVPPDQPQLERLSALAGTPVAFVRYMHDGATVLRLMQTMPIDQVERIAERIAAEPDVEFAQPDYINQIHLVPNDPCYPSNALGSCNGGYQWDLFDPAAGINAPAAWNITTGSAGISVAVIDTGALFNHPDLAGRFIGGYDMITTGLGVVTPNDGDSRDPDASDVGDWTIANQCGVGAGASNSSFHGSHVAGTIGASANNATGIAGINWVSQIVPVRVLGSCGGWSSDIADGIVWASGGTVTIPPTVNPNPARVLNLSIGGFRFNQTCDAVYVTAINGALARNTVIAVSAGNSNYNSSYSAPANCSGVITTAATGQKGFKSYYSNWGSQVEIAAPGGDFRFNATTNPGQYGILSSLNNGATNPSPSGYVYVEYQGTSMASPHVAGVASLMLSVNPLLTPSQVISKLQVSSRAFVTGGPACDTSNVPNSSGVGTVPNANWLACNCTTALCGAGLIDAYRSVRVSAVNGGPTTTAVVSSANPALVGASVMFTATVVGIAPAGFVNFKDGGVSIAGCAAVPLTGGSGDSRTAACTTSALVAGSHSITAVYTETNPPVASNNNASSTSLALTQTINVVGGGAAKKRINFDANLTDDLAWRSLTGQTAVWLMNGLTYSSYAIVLGDPNWTVTHTGDLNGDNKTDLIWRHASGMTVAWLMNGTGYTSYATLVTDANWVVQRLADFDGDGKADILWRNTVSGETAIWLMNGLAPIGSAILSADPNWLVTNVGDFNGDGKADLVWRNASTGQTAIWLMAGLTPTSGAVILTDANWAVTHVADVSGDGKSDLVWRNSVTGETAIWLMSGLAPTSGGVILADASWAVTRVGDFDGNGKDDLLWLNNGAGQTSIWLMNGLAPTAGSVVLSDANWRVTHVADLNGDGKSDLVWRNSASGASTGWLMNGTSYSSFGSLLTDPSWSVSPPNGL
jgi:serine protease